MRTAINRKVCILSTRMFSVHMFQFGKDFVVYFRKTYFTKNKSKMKITIKQKRKTLKLRTEM